MTIKKIDNTSIDSNRVVLRPSTYYTVSGSQISGSVPLIQNPSDSIRTVNVQTSSPIFNFVNVIETKINNIRAQMLSGSDATSDLKDLLTKVTNAPQPSKHFKEFNITLDNIPGFATSSIGVPSGTLGSLVNSIIKKENESNENIQYGFTNYNCIGFVTSSMTNIDTGLIYNQNNVEDVYSFVTSFFLKAPKKTSSEFHPGTIFHIDNVVSVSLVSGSNIDKYGNVSSFKIVSQIGDSNEISPDRFVYSSDSLASNQVIYSDFSKNVAYTESDPIEKEAWYHIVVSYTRERSNTYHRIYVNESKKGESIGDPVSLSRGATNSFGNKNSHVVIGNKISASTSYDGFFINEFEENQKYTSLGYTSDPSSTFESPFRGEVHEICFWSNISENIPVSRVFDDKGTTQKGNSSGLGYPKFYLPFLFEAVSKQKVNRQPISNADSVVLKKAPHENFLVSNGMRFPSVNITSFLKAYDLNTNSTYYPRCVGMEEVNDLSSHPDFNSSNYSNFHDIASQIPQYFIRNNLVRSCDNGTFSHDYLEYENIISNTNGNFQYLSSSLGVGNPGHVLIKNYVTSSQTTVPQFKDVSSMDNNLYSENFIQVLGNPVFDKNINNLIQRPADHVPFTKHFSGFDHSNLVTYIDIPSMFYSQQIHPGTFQIVDNSISGSDGMLTYKIKDNGLGALYRDDAAASDTRNRCGFILYDRGVVVLTHPSLCMIGKEDFEISFRGEHDLNVININAHAGKYEFNNSLGSNYNQIGKKGEEDNSSPITLITGVEYLDENLNVVMKSSFSQPIEKREFDEILFRSRIDI